MADVELPPRPFLYTLDQIASLTGFSLSTLKVKYLYLDGVSRGMRKPSHLHAISISNRDERPDWRVSENEFLRWLRRHGFRVYERRLRL